MSTKPKPKKAVGKAKKAQALIIACPDDRPLRGQRLLRQMFSAPGAKFTMEEICNRMQFKGKTPAASAAATMSVMGNPKKTDDPLRIVLNRETRFYAVAKPNGEGPTAKKTPKSKSKKKAVSKGAANGPRMAAA